MEAEYWFIQRCLNLEIGASAAHSVLGFTVHRWKDGWWALWDFPLGRIPLGRDFRTDTELKNFLAGNNNIGIAITPPAYIHPELLAL